MFSWLARPFRALAKRLRARRNRRLRRWADMSLLGTLDAERTRHAMEVQSLESRLKDANERNDATEAKLKVKEHELLVAWQVMKRNQQRVERETAEHAMAQALAEHGMAVADGQPRKTPQLDTYPVGDSQT